MKKVLLLWVVSILIFSGILPSYAVPNNLELEIQKILETHNTAGASIALVEADGTKHSFGVGVSNQTTQNPANAETLFRIGSISKLFTSMSVLKLVEEEALDLDDPINQWTDTVDYHNPWEDLNPIKIVHLLSHTTGWDDMHMSEYANNDPTPLDLESAFKVYPKARTSRWVPGSRVAYNNSGPGVAAYIVEKVTGQVYEDYVESTFFRPLGMDTATFYLSDAYINNGATLYQRQVEQPYWHIILRPSGSINASAKDMVQLLDFFIHEDNPSILSEDSLESMRQPQGSIFADRGLELAYSLSHYAEIHNGFVWYGHNGGVNGGLSDFKYIPEMNVGYYVAINSDNGNALYEIIELLKAHLTEGLSPEMKPYTKDETIDTSDLVGYVRAVNPRNASLFFLEYLVSVGRIEARPEGIAMVGVIDGSEDLYIPINEYQYVDPDTGRIALVVAEDPLIGMVIHNDWMTLKPVSALSVYGPLAFVILWLLVTIVIILRYLVLLILKVLKKPIKGSIKTHLLPIIQMFTLGMFVRGFMGVIAVDFMADNRLISNLMAYSTILFFITAIGSVILLTFKREKTYSYYQCFVYSVMNLIIGIYLTNMGITGFQFF